MAVEAFYPSGEWFDYNQPGPEFPHPNGIDPRNEGATDFARPTELDVDTGHPLDVYVNITDARKLVDTALADANEGLYKTVTASQAAVVNPPFAPPALPVTQYVRPEGLTPKATSAERTVEPAFKVREATADDLAAMVEIDMRSFSKVYENYGGDEEARRADLTEKFRHRFELLGGKWMPVVTQPGSDGQERIVGFMTTCPTSKDPAEFTSWEDTTDNGRLDGLYDPAGKNAYVVTLSMDPGVKGQRGQNLLFMHQIGAFISEGMNTAFFESRMPGLRNWVRSQCHSAGVEFSTLTDDQKAAYAQEYFGLTRDRKGKQVPYDPLLKVYDGVGCNLLKVLPNAYQDEPSMNFGVLCTYENPLPARLRRSGIASKAVGGLVNLASKSSWLSRKMFG